MKAITISMIIGFIGIAVIVGVLVFYYSQILEFFRDPLWVSVFVTIVLVIINGKTINEMKKARMAEFMPHVRAELSFFTLIFVLKMTNFGKGPAINVEVQITLLPTGETKLWKQAIMSPNESIKALLSGGANIYQISKTTTKIMVKGEYQDIFGHVFKIHDEMDIKEFVEQAEKIPSFGGDITDLVNRIAVELREIKEQLSRIRQK